MASRISTFVVVVDSTSSYIRIEKNARAITRYIANDFAKAMKISVTQKDSALVIAPFFSISPADNWHFQNMIISIYLPSGVEVYRD